jgi:hypothetical protein
MPYIVIFLILTVFVFVEINFIGKLNKGLNVFYLLLVFFLILFAGTRYETGFDYNQYRDLFEVLNLTNFTSNTVEFGYAAFNYFCRIIGLNFNGFLLVFAAITLMLKAEFYRKNALYISLALINYYSIGFLINDMGQIRHGLSIAIALYAMFDLLHENNRGFFVKSVMATLFHTSAIVLFPAYFLVKYTLKPIHMFGIIALLMPFLFIDIRGFLYRLIDYLPLFQLQAKITFYVYSDEFGKSLGLNLSFLLRIAVLFFLLFFEDVGENYIKGYKKLILLYFYGIILYMLFNSIAEFATRASTFFKNLEPIILPFFVYQIKNRYAKNGVALLVVLYAFWSVYKIILTEEFGSYFQPYKSFILNYFYD